MVVTISSVINVHNLLRNTKLVNAMDVMLGVQYISKMLVVKNVWFIAAHMDMNYTYRLNQTKECKINLARIS
jgi:hypothetical protein